MKLPVYLRRNTRTTPRTLWRHILPQWLAGVTGIAAAFLAGWSMRADWVSPAIAIPACVLSMLACNEISRLMIHRAYLAGIKEGFEDASRERHGGEPPPRPRFSFRN